MTTNKQTSNDPASILADGKLAQSFGPVFPNGVKDGAYKMDLGSVKAVSAINSWSFNQGMRRGAQKLAVYGSNSPSDPGWDLAKFTRLGAIDTGKAQAKYVAASLRPKDAKALGSFRWILWSVSPVSNLGGGENTAFQELSVSTLKLPLGPEPTKLGLPKVRGQIVRIELPGEQRTLSLAEVLVFEKGANLAKGKKATQSTTAFSGVAARAVDGNVDGDYRNNSVTHTESDGTDAWWEVDLGKIVDIEEILVHNRTDSHGDRLDRFTLKVLDSDKKVVFSKEKVPHSEAISFRHVAPIQKPKVGNKPKSS